MFVQIEMTEGGKQIDMEYGAQPVGVHRVGGANN
jgi:hypothetical protein